MMKKVFSFTLIGFLIIALLLHFAGVQSLDLQDTQFYAMIKTAMLRFNQYKIEIPSVPSIPKMAGGWAFLIDFINGLVGLINVIITIINVFIQLIQFVFIFESVVRDFILAMTSNNLQSVIAENPIPLLG